MMAQREWPLGSDPAGAGTAMITSGAMPAPLPAHIGMSQINPITAGKDFADPLRAQRRALSAWIALPQTVAGPP